MKLKKTACTRAIKKYSFPNRSIEMWNNLDETVVQLNWTTIGMEAEQHEHTSSCKTQLGKYN
ncbi:hypothetical protein E2C01_100811 [Portunus trituberculatus]|uniref:Uncharacterized protein n=1 Tax=Portunus trituberculatus TaxID=210409 RepID=A0A5B7KDZ7_PORTR|nr:hypothetical protein [Portunus trituberculatus]